MMALLDRCSAVSHIPVTMFVVFGLPRHTSITESVRQHSCCCLPLLLLVCTNLRLCPDRRDALTSPRGSDPRGQAHKSRRSPETSSSSDSRWQKQCHTPTRRINCSPVVSTMMGWSTHVPFSGTCEDADCMLTTMGGCARHVNLMPLPMNTKGQGPGLSLKVGLKVCGCLCSYLLQRLVFPSLQVKFRSNNAGFFGVIYDRNIRRVSVCLTAMLTSCGLHLIQTSFR